ncbi:MAG: GtrA family protein, partial [Flavobacterium sp.]
SGTNEFLIFALFSTLAIILNQLIVWTCVEYLSTGAPFAKINAIILVAIFNFLTRKYLIFKA